MIIYKTQEWLINILWKRCSYIIRFGLIVLNRTLFLMKLFTRIFGLGKKIILPVILISSSMFSQAATFYVDAISGDNAFDGTSPTFVSGNEGPFQTIMHGIGLAAPGDTLIVSAGSYFENLIIDKSIYLFGNNHNIAGNGSRSTETILYPQFGDLSSPPAGINTIINVLASDVEISGFEMNGDNASLISGNIVNGVDVDISGACFYTGIDVNISFNYNRVVNMNEYGFYGQGNVGVPSSGNSVMSNYFGNFGDNSYAIFNGENFYANITDNVIRTMNGAVILNMFSASSSATWELTNNDIQTTDYGIYAGSFSGAPDDLMIENNTIQSPSGYFGSDGIALEDVNNDANVHLKNNYIERFENGLSSINSSLNSLTFSGDSIVDCDNGIIWDNGDLGGLNDTITLTNVVIQGSAINGLGCLSETNLLSLETTGTKISDGDNGVVLDGNIQFIPNNISINNINDYYILYGLTNSGLTHGANVDATNSTFDGLLGSLMNENECFNAEDRIFHYTDNNDFPWVEYKQDFVYVSGNDGNDSIQPAIDILPSAGNIVVKGITTGEYLNVPNALSITASGLVSVNGIEINAPLEVLTVWNEIQVEDSLILTAGLIDTRAGLLTLGNFGSAEPGFVDQGGPTSYVNGALRRVVESSPIDTAYFPIGKAGDFRPMQMIISHSSNGDMAAYRADVVNSPVVGNTVDPTLTHVSAKRYWLILQNGNPSVTDVKYGLTYGTLALDDEVSDAANLRIAALKGTNWSDLGGVGSAAGTGAILSTNAWVDFGPVTIANSVGGSNALGRRGPSPDFTFAGSCASDSFTFTDASTSSGDPITKWFWDFGDVARTDDTSVSQNPKWKYDMPGTYTAKLYVTTSGGEIDSAENIVTVAGAPTAGFDITVPCSPNPITVIDTSTTSGGVITSWDWYHNGTLFGNANSESLVPTVGNHTIKLVVANDGGCIDSTEIQVYYGDSIKMSISPGTNITKCEGDTITLAASGSAASYIWSNGSTAQSIRIQAAGTYSITATNSNQCFEVDSASVTNSTSPIADAGNDREMELGSNTVLGGSSTAGMNYLWTPAEGLDDALLMNPTASPSISTTYILRVFDNVGCDDFDTVEVTVVKPVVIIVPNLISPNGDGANDVWDLSSVPGIGNTMITVYSRWGKEVFATDNYNHDWRGTYEGEPLPSGTYVYIIEFLKGGLETVKGNLQIIR